MVAKTQKVLSVVFGVLFYGLSLPMFYARLVFGFISSELAYLSEIWYFVCFGLLPLLALLVPVGVKFIFKKPFYQSVLFGVVAVVLCLAIPFAVHLGISEYMSDFTPEKWQNDDYTELRYHMTEDLEQEYDLIGMHKDEVKQLLGKSGDYDQTLRYEVRRSWVNQEFYCLSYDENGIITSTYSEWVD